MPDKFIRHGATYCGDGTTSDLAASNGAVGAWNNINVLEGTAPAYGSLAAGDVVHIRSKDAAGADITRTHSAASILYLGVTAAIETDQVHWVLDHGSVWSGVSGTLTYQLNNASASLYVQPHNVIHAGVQDRVVEIALVAGTTSNGFLRLLQGSVAQGWKLDTTAKTGTSGWAIGVYDGAQLVNPTIKFGRISTASGPGVLSLSDGIAINPDIELTDATTSASAPIFTIGSDTRGRVYGGQVWGAGAISGCPLMPDLPSSTSEAGLVLYGFEYPKELTLPAPGTNEACYLHAFGADGGVGDVLVETGGYIDSRNDGLYPYLNATLPNASGTGWSFKVYPYSAAYGRALFLPISKYYTDTAGVRTLTLEINMSNDFLSRAKPPNRRNLWIEVDYVDNSTGRKRRITSQLPSGGSLDSGSAWSAASYGAVALTPKILSVTTPTAIKQDTVVTATLVCAIRSVSTPDIFFVDPDVVIST